MTLRAIRTPVLDAAVRQVAAAIAADPRVPRHLAVVAPGGHGKTVVLAELAAAYRRAGMPVVSGPDSITDLAGREPAALVVDDAHRLAGPHLARLRELAEAGHPAIVVAYRPWPVSEALAELAAVLGRAGPPLVLAPLDRARTAAVLAAASGTAPLPELVHFVHAQTAGVPRFVERLASLTECALPESAVLAFRADLDQLDDAVQRFLLAVEAGAGRHAELLAGLFGGAPDALGGLFLGPAGGPPRGQLGGSAGGSGADVYDVVAEVTMAARATGLVGEDGALLPISRRAVATLVPAERRVAVRQRLAQLQLDAGGPVLALASGLLDTGVAGPAMAAVFRTAAAEAAPDRPALATRCYAAAATAGAPLTELATPWADAAARAGDVDLALRLADRAIALRIPATPGATATTAATATAATATATTAATAARPTHPTPAATVPASTASTSASAAVPGSVPVAASAAASGLVPVAASAAAPGPAVVADAAAAAALPATAPATGPASAAAFAAAFVPAAVAAAMPAAMPAAEPDRVGAAEVAAAALAHRGELGRSAELYRWAGTRAAAAFAAVALIATGQPPRRPTSAPDTLDTSDRHARHGLPGRPTQAPDTLDTGDGDARHARHVRHALPGRATRAGGPEGLVEGAAGLMADGVARSVRGAGVDALAMLARAATLLEPAGATVLLPDSPAALTGIVSLHCGEPAIGDSVLERAATAGVGGPLMVPRHLLLRAWIRLVGGRLADAAALLDRIAGRRLTPRDALFADGLRVGLARRAGDLPALAAAWRRASEAVVCHPVDLFTLLPLGEFAVAAARLDDQARLAPRLAEARALLAALGDPPLWANTLHWSGVQAAIVADDLTAARQHVATLAAGAPLDRHGALLHDAASCWLAVLSGDVDPEQVEAAARGLHDAGLRWDAARLAGQAAIRTGDRKVMVRLLDRARQLQGQQPRPPRRAAAGVPAAPTTPAAAARLDLATPVPAVTAPAAPPAQLADGVVDGPADSGLSARELEVAELAAGGLTYKEIGGRLFISAKTVEHHMARMRRKLGCDSRGELLARLRELATAGDRA